MVIIDKSIEKQNLHKRIAIGTINLLGNQQAEDHLDFYDYHSQLLSMWITNVDTSWSYSCLPIALTIIKKEELTSKPSPWFGIDLMLSITYISSIGGSSNILRPPS